jgi:hypothetical protein
MTNTTIQVVNSFSVVFTHSHADGTEKSFTKSRAVVDNSELLEQILGGEDTENFRAVRIAIRTELLEAWAQAEQILKGSSLEDMLLVVEVRVSRVVTLEQCTACTVYLW